MYENPGLYHADCMEAMKEFPDQFFDLAVVDPPYGIGILSMQYTKNGGKRASRNAAAESRDYHRFSEWDIKPEKAYFDELFRVSKKQIIWGGQLLCRYAPPVKIVCCLG